MDIVAVKVGNEIRMDSRLMASRFGNKHKNVLALIAEHQARFEELGQLLFEAETVINSVGAANQTKYAMLTEDQTIFLLTLARNSAPTVQLKMKLVQAFSKARDLLASRPFTLSSDPIMAQLELVMQMRSEQLALASEVQGITARLDASPITSEKVGTIHRLGQELGMIMGNYRSAWTLFNQRFGLASYRDLPTNRYEEGVKFLRVQISAYTGKPLLEIA